MTGVRTPLKRHLVHLALAGIVALAAGLRLGDLGLMELKDDEATALALAERMLDEGALARVGLVNSAGRRNPPLFVWAVAAAASISTNPKVVTGGLVGGLATVAVFATFLVVRPRLGTAAALWSALLFACAPWPVLYGRKLWAQDLLPLAGVLLLHAGLRVAERSRTRWAAAIPILLAVAWQLHLSATVLVVVFAVLLVWRARHVRWPALLAGAAVALALLWPYLSRQVERDFEDLRGLTTTAAGRASPLDGWRWTLYVAADNDFAYACGLSQADWRAFQSDAGHAFRRLGKVVAWSLLSGGVLLVLLWPARRAWRRGRARPDEDPCPPATNVQALWQAGGLAVVAAAPLSRLHPHYAIVLLPVPFVLMGGALGHLGRRGGLRGKLLAAALGALVVTANLSSLLSFRAYLRDRGGTAGDYGVVYEHKAELTAWLDRSELGIAAAPGPEYQLLLGSGASRRPRVRIIDGLRRPDLHCSGGRRFGPLLACPAR